MKVLCLLVAVVVGAMGESSSSQFASVFKTIGPAIRTANSSNRLALELFRRVSGEQNVFIAPFSISTVLSMAYQGAAGRTAEEMANVLGYSNDSKDLKSYLLDGFKSTRLLISEDTGQNELIDVNTILVDANIKVLPDIKQKLQEHYGASVEEVNFQRASTLKLLDDLVAVKTKGYIQKAFGNREIPPNTIMVLANIIYFKGVWDKQFDPKQTEKGTFLNGGQSAYAKETDFMTMTDYAHYAYYPKLKLSALDLAYTGLQLRMTILLPDDPSHLGQIEDSLKIEHIQEIILDMEPTLVEIKLPKFKITSQLDLKSYLQKMGMNRAFSQNDSEMPHFTGKEILYINEFVHQTVIEVNEQGTVAAAATAAAHGTRARVVKFHAKHPFLFFIRDSRTGLVLFMGLCVYD